MESSPEPQSEPVSEEPEISKGSKRKGSKSPGDPTTPAELPESKKAKSDEQNGGSEENEAKELAVVDENGK